MIEAIIAGGVAGSARKLSGSDRERARSVTLPKIFCPARVVYVTNSPMRVWSLSVVTKTYSLGFSPGPLTVPTGVSRGCSAFVALDIIYQWSVVSGRWSGNSDE